MPASEAQPAPADVVEAAREILNRHTEYMDGLSRGQVMMRTSNALAAVEEALTTRAAIEAGASDEVARLREALREIETLSPQPVADGFVQGPALLLEIAQRIARQALNETNHASKWSSPNCARGE